MGFNNYFEKYILRDYPYEGTLHNSLRDQLESFTETAASICPENIERAFISTKRNDRGNIDFERLWFFSRRYSLSILNWQSSDKPEIYLVPLNIQWLKTQSSFYDFHKASPSSILDVDVKFKDYHLGYIEHITFSAVAENCDELKDVLIKYLKPSVVTLSN